MNTDKAFDELYRLARNCAEYNHRGCTCSCEQCEYNIFLYTNKRDATLIKANAYADYRKREELKEEIRQRDNAALIPQLILAGIAVGFIVWICRACGI